ncbi:B-cell differentiation antigen CD72-like [Malurus melanocephalus]|uniref:B-cell differentiation antigen CD72-like n=1 Tax=Malurus melanocephalus TaxID=175006 RepID=UPI002546CF6D|nr:B-cell differentiation antigen CD72-like [Malurus melanocephalus]
MAQSVVYADLKFAAGPSSAVPDDNDSPYENVPLGPVTEEPSPGRWTRRWHVPTAPLAASLLLLLLVVAVVALGACYWQVTRSLEDTSREHTAEQGRLSQELRAQGQSLERTQLELAWARAELQRAWREGNISQLVLERRNTELGRTQLELDVLQDKMEVVQEKLRSSEGTVSSLRACMYSECCPRGWILYRTKCLFILATMQTWQESKKGCADREAQLLAKEDWAPLDFMRGSGTKYWIGTRIPYVTRSSSVQVDNKHQ